MIFDKENLFYDHKPVTELGSASDVVANVGGGSAYDPLFLVVVVAKAALGGKLTLALQTDDDEAFSAAETVGTYEIPAGAQGQTLAVKLPYGLKKFIRLAPSGTQSGDAIVNAGLVVDADLPL